MILPRKSGMSHTGRLFVKNAAILTLTSLLLRAAGMGFRIWVSALVGAQGMGLYQLILSVYVLASGFASSGIVVAVTRMTADELACGTRASVRGVLRRCLGLSAAMGVLSALALALLAGPIGERWLSDGRAVPALRIMSLALPCMAVSCCLRGYFTARRRAGVPSGAQMTEQAVRIVLAVVLLRLWLPGGAERACMAIMTADVISEAAGCLYCVIAYLFDRRGQTDASPRPHCPPERMSRAIWGITAPITASHYLTTLLRTVESVLVPDCLTRSELSRELALELFGMVKGMALPLILFPSTLLTALSTLLTPEISRANTAGRQGAVEAAVRRAMRVTFLLAIPAAGVFLLYPDELGILIYGEERLGRIIAALAPFMPLMYAESVAVGILRGLGEQACSLRYGILDSVVRIVLIALTVPRMGLSGFLLVMAVSNLLTPLLHLRRMEKTARCRIDLGEWVLLPLCAMIPAWLCGKLVDRLTPVQALPLAGRMALTAAVVAAVFCAALWVISTLCRPRVKARREALRPVRSAFSGSGGR